MVNAVFKVLYFWEKPYNLDHVKEFYISFLQGSD